MLNNLLLSVILGTVFIGTLYPLFAEGLTGEKLSVGPPYFNAVAGPVALLLGLLLMVGPLLRWRRHAAPVARLVAPSALIMAAALVISLIAAPAMSLLSRLGLAVGVGLVPASLMPLVGRSLRRTPIAPGHGSRALGVRGVDRHGERQRFKSETLAIAKPGERLKSGRAVEFASIDPGRANGRRRGELRATRGEAYPASPAVQHP